MPKQTIYNQKKQIRIQRLTITRQKEALKNQGKKIKQLAYYDSLTNLPNRRMLKERFKQSSANALRYKKKLAVLFFDLDQFKLVNDNFGHDIGDLLLQETGRRLTSFLRKSDTVARIGGDEFVILLNDINKKEDAAIVTKKLLMYVRDPFMLNSHQIEVKASIGISIYPDDSQDLETLVKKADAAMRTAKKTSDSYKYY